MKINRKGFTLVEIMIVVAIIGILAAIAIPNFLKSREDSQRNACIANLKQIEGAQEQAKLAGTPSPDAAAVKVYLKQQSLKCPKNNSGYDYAASPVVCPAGDLTHILPN